MPAAVAVAPGAVAAADVAPAAVAADVAPVASLLDTQHVHVQQHQHQLHQLQHDAVSYDDDDDENVGLGGHGSCYSVGARSHGGLLVESEDRPATVDGVRSKGGGLMPRGVSSSCSRSRSSTSTSPTSGALTA